LLLYAILQVSRVVEAFLFLNDGDLGCSGLGEVLGALLKALLDVGPDTAPLAWHLEYHSKEDKPQVRTGVVGVVMSISDVAEATLLCRSQAPYVAAPVLCNALLAVGSSSTVLPASLLHVQNPTKDWVPFEGFLLTTVHPLCDEDMHTCAARLHARAALRARKGGVRRMPLVQLLELALDVSGWV
jgi:hypothetical protein